MPYKFSRWKFGYVIVPLKKRTHSQILQFATMVCRQLWRGKCKWIDYLFTYCNLNHS